MWGQEAEPELKAGLGRRGWARARAPMLEVASIEGLLTFRDLGARRIITTHSGQPPAGLSKAPEARTCQHTCQGPAVAFKVLLPTSGL